MSEASRLRWQCRRGMRELDVLLTRYLDDGYSLATDGQKAAFRKLLALPDPELNAYLLGGARPADEELQDAVSRILLRADSE